MAPPLDPPPDYALFFQSREETKAACKGRGRGYRVRSEETWAAARGDYERGLSAEKVCAAFDLGLSALRQRARREGWRRCDQADPDPVAETFPPEPEAALPEAALHELAWRSMSQAMRRGRVYEARAWMRLAADLAARIEAGAQAARHRDRLAALEAERAARAATGAPAPDAFAALAQTLEQVQAIARAASGAPPRDALSDDEMADGDLADDDLADDDPADAVALADDRSQDEPTARVNAADDAAAPPGLHRLHRGAQARSGRLLDLGGRDRPAKTPSADPDEAPLAP